MSAIRVKRRGKGWGVQEKGRWFWRWIGPWGNPRYGIWPTSGGALWFANLCERVDKREASDS